MVSCSKSYLSILGLLVVLSLPLALAAAQFSDAPTAYDLLQRYDLPIGVLPEGVQSYLLRDDGTFDVYLADDCEFKVGGYLLRYKKKISGKVAPGTLSNLKGVSVQVLILWVGVNEVVRDGDELHFYIGLLSATFPVSTFDECPRCRDKLNCAPALASEA